MTLIDRDELVTDLRRREQSLIELSQGKDHREIRRIANKVEGLRLAISLVESMPTVADPQVTAPAPEPKEYEWFGGELVINIPGGARDFERTGIIVGESSECTAEVKTRIVRALNGVPAVAEHPDTAALDKLMRICRRVTAHSVNPATGGRLILEADILALIREMAAIDAARAGEKP